MPARTPGGGHHALAVHEVVLLLETDTDRGLTDDEAAARLARFGPNVLPAAARGGTLRRLLRQFQNPLVYVLLVAGVVTLLLAEYVDSAVIVGVVVVNAAVGFLQESKAESALDALRAMVRTEARVVRGGRHLRVPSEQVVPGDLVLVEAGEKVPADLRLARADELRADESALTGESLPVRKDEVAVPDETPVADRRNVLYSGTLLTGGSGAGIVVATGAETELGRIHRLVGAAQVLDTPLTAKLARFSRVLTLAILVLAGVTFAVGLARGEAAGATFTAAVALAVGAIPEGLPAAVTITLAIGVARMARRRAVIRRLPAVETLGSTTVICTDKTGTLTENQMTVQALWTVSGRYEVSGGGYTPLGEIRDPDGGPAPTGEGGALRWSLLAGVACNDARLDERAEGWTVLGDPTEGAMLVVGAKVGLRAEEVAAELPRVAAVPFTSERQYMATLHDQSDGARVVLVKGAVERIVEWSTAALDADGGTVALDRAAVLAAAGELAGEGLRVLATALRRVDRGDGLAEESLPGQLIFTGLHAMLDPPREAAAAAVASCRRAGIAVKMITGDHRVTASAIAVRLGLLAGEPGPGEVLSGEDLAGLSDAERPEAVRRAAVFARVSPEQKLRLMEALQAEGQVVAMTGDGVNDAPALRQADIGVAMGRSGTEVAKEAADIVLTDDDFATIESAVEEGRGVFANLTKFITWTLPTNTGEGLVILVAIVLGTALPILPSQILWINMTTAVALGLTLAFEPKEPGIMDRPPRDPAQPLLTGALVVRILLVSALLVAGAWWLFQWELDSGAELAEARTAAVNLFVTVQAFYLFSCRSLTRSPWRLGLFGNRWLIGGVLVQALGQLALTYLPVMNTLFRTAPIDLGAWWRILGIAVLVSAVVALDKRFGWFGRRLG
ncbi:HAD-IC family P-type ATPase [Micromonospora coxensis]|uniref:Cation-transporting ATPase F n=1 Tax=Micromonospora coxensis TaxID=356852 RepID=A0A1C5JFL4_9ACTN|nr:HAD-IC family P-type ATPase [Micromonospora coxensis]SCG69101.1 cation-transporting ATPase F [Micromonospora coxensis]